MVKTSHLYFLNGINKMNLQWFKHPVLILGGYDRQSEKEVMKIELCREMYDRGRLGQWLHSHGLFVALP